MRSRSPGNRRCQHRRFNAGESARLQRLSHSTNRRATSVRTPINSSLVSGTQYVDRNFQFGENYRYVVRAVSLGTEGAQVESLNSNSLSVSPRDIFRAVGAGVDYVSLPRPARLSIFFPANPEADIAGYNIYRSTDPDLPKDQLDQTEPGAADADNFPG